MKKYLVVWGILALPVVSVAQASRQAGIEYLTPLVQQIIGLLQESIFTLQSELNACKAGKTIVKEVIKEVPIYVERTNKPENPEIGQVKDEILKLQNKLSELQGKKNTITYEFQTRPQ